MPYYSVTVDTEEEWDWDAGWPVKQHSLNNIASTPKLHAICKEHGAKTTWFTNWSVMNEEETRATVLELTEGSDAELGMHIHPWLTPPLTEHSDLSVRESFLHNSTSSVIHQKLDSVWQLFLEHGCRPRSFRGGRYSCGPEVQSFLQHPERQFLADASVVPFTTWADDGAPDYRDRDHIPTRIGPVVAGGSPLWEIPVTLAYTRNNIEFWADTFDLIEHSFLRHLRLCGLLSSTGIVRRVWLNFECTPAKEMIALLAFLEKLDVPCVTLTLHSSSIMNGGNPYSGTQKSVDNIFGCIEEVLGWLAAHDGYSPITIGDLAQQLEKDHSGEKSQLGELV